MERNKAAHHRTILLLAVGIVAAAGVLQVLPSQRVALTGLSDYPLPHSCLSRSLFGWNCPACGLTRSFVHLFHGDVRSSWETHRLGWLFAAIVVSQIPYRTVALRRPTLIGRRRPWASAAIYAGLMLLILNWVVSLLID